MLLKTQFLFWVAALAVLIGLIILFKSVLLPFVIGGVLAYLLNPLVTKLCGVGLSRRLSVLSILSVFVVTFVILLALLSPILLREAIGLIEALPQYFTRLQNVLDPYITLLQNRFGTPSADEIQTLVKDNLGRTLQVSQTVVSEVLGGILTGGQAIIKFIVFVLLIPIVAYFMMMEWPSIHRSVDDLLPRKHADTIRGLGVQIDQKIAGFIRGQITVCLLLGFFYAIALSIAGLNYGFLIGLSTGLLTIIPYVGSTIGLVTSLSVAAFQSGGDLTYIALIGGIFAVGQFTEGNFITPKLMGESVGLHPLWIIFALMAGGSLLGLLGMFLAVPVAAVISVLVIFMLDQYRKSPYFNGK
jgi:predicted PurR-regulated permease PerM